MALDCCIGEYVAEKDVATTVKGGIKTFVGFLVVTAGAGVIESSLAPFGEMFQVAFNMQGVVPNNEAIVALAPNYLWNIYSTYYVSGMAFNILIARITRYKYIYLTGHATLYMACMIAVILSVTGMSTFSLVLFGGLALGICNTIFPAIAQPFTRQITKNDSVALGHTGNFGYALSGLIGKYVGNKEKSTEDINFPKGLAFYVTQQ